MENETKYFDDLISRRKEILKALKPLYAEYHELEEANASNREKNVIARKINPLVEEVEQIDGELLYFSRKLKGMEDIPAEEVKEEVVEVEPSKEEKKGLRGIALMLAVALGFTSGLAVYSITKNNNCSNSKNIDRTVDTDTIGAAIARNNVEVTATPTATVAPVPTATAEVTATPTAEATAVPTATPTPVNNDVLVDITNEEDVEKAVNRIYDKDLDSMIAGLNDPAFEAQVSREDIADVIRFVNGELPLYRTYDSTTFSELANKFVYVYGAQGGHGNELYPVHYEYLTKDNSTLAKYCKSYDDIYNKIAEYRQTGNVDGFVEEVGVLTSKLYNEWHLFGMYGGFNPYQFNDKDQFLAFNAALGRYANYVKEYLISNNLTVCIPTCYEVNGTTYDVAENAKLVETRDIYEAMLYGTSKNGEISIVVGSDVFNPNAMVGQNLIKVLNEKAEQSVKVLR